MNTTLLSQVPMLYVKTAKGTVLIEPSEILYLEARNKHSLIYLNNLTSIYAHHLLKWFEEKLPEPQFYRCHNSFIVNCYNIDCTCGDRIIQKMSSFQIPISRNRRQYYKDNLELFKQKTVFQSLQNLASYSDFIPSTLNDTNG